MHTVELDQQQMSELLQPALDLFSDHVVDFARPSVDPLRADLGGSGTLVTIDGTHGILTAGHVIDALDDKKPVGLILPSRLEQQIIHTSMRMDYCRVIKFPRSAVASHRRPDLGFIIPPYDTVFLLKSRKVFYNLTLEPRRGELLAKMPVLEEGKWVLSGYSEERIRELPPAQGFKIGVEFAGMHGIGRVVRETLDRQRRFDYLSFQALYNEQYEGPNRYGGFSGGPLWQLRFADRDGKLVNIDRVLSGMAFFQCRQIAAGGQVTRDILCHGRMSLYRELIDLVRRETAG